MPSFKDKDGREWHPHIDNGVVRRFDRTSDLGFFEAVLTNQRGRLFNTRYLLPLLYEAVRHEIEGQTVGYTDFCSGLDNGDRIAQAAEALSLAMLPYFPETSEVAEGGGELERPPVPGPGEMSTS